MPGFKIQSSHPFINPAPQLDEEDEADPYINNFTTNYMFSAPTHSMQETTQPKTNFISGVTNGSASGMAIRTSQTGMSDFY